MDERLLTEKLVGFDSSNAQGVKLCAGFVRGWLEARDVQVHELSVRELPVLVADAGPEDAPHTVLLHGHLDVVPGHEEQFEPRLEGDRLFGRGAYDMKGALAALMLAIADLQGSEGVRVRLGIVPDEESEEEVERGCDLLLEQGFVGDFAITGEPTDMLVGVAAKGVLAMRIRVDGRAAHGATPWLGQNAILKAIEVFHLIEALPFAGESSELYDRPSINLGRILGGDALNKVPDACVIDVDVRYLPEQEPEAILDQVKAVEGAEVISTFRRPPALVDPASPFVRALCDAASPHHPDQVTSIGRDGASDAVSFLRVGIPAVEFGPLGAGHHGPEEWVSSPLPGELPPHDHGLRGLTSVAIARSWSRSVIDEPRDDELGDDEGTDHADEGPDAPRPQTWAGRARAEADEPADDEAATPEPAGDEAHEEADEREEPPDEFEFSEDEADEPEDEDEDGSDAADEAEPEEDDHAETADAEEPEAGAEGEPEDAEEPDAEGEAEDKPEDKPEAGEKPGQETVEVDTLAISDREAEQEAAHAGLKARAEKTAAHRVATSGAQAAVAGAVASLPDEGAGEAPKRNVWWRFLAASFVVVASTAAATLDRVPALPDRHRQRPQGRRDVRATRSTRSLSEVDGGDPQTILILGSDKRTTAPGDPGRSDTTMLLRVDPEKEFLSLLSLPARPAGRDPGLRNRQAERRLLVRRAVRGEAGRRPAAHAGDRQAAARNRHQPHRQRRLRGLLRRDQRHRLRLH